MGLLRRLLRRTPDPEAPSPEDRDLQSDLVQAAVHHRVLYEDSQDIRDADHAIMLFRQAATRVRSSFATFVVAYNLGFCYSSRFEQSDDLADLDEAIRHFHEALSAVSDDSHDRKRVLEKLTDSLGMRYRHSGDPEDLRQAVLLAEESVALTPMEAADPADILGGLCLDLLARYRYSHDSAALDQGIELASRAAALTPESAHKEASEISYISAMLHRARYDHTLDLAELGRAIHFVRRAIDLSPSGHSLKVRFLNALADYLATRNRFSAVENRSVSDLEEAIKYQEQAVQLAAPDSPDLADSLHRLGSYLRVKSYFEADERPHVSKAIDVSRQALAITMDNSPRRADFLHGLGLSLMCRYRHTGNMEDIEEAIHSYRESSDNLPPQARQRMDLLHSLANALSEHYDRTSRSSDLENAIDLFRRVCLQALEVENHDLVFSCAQSWGAWALKRIAWAEAAEAYGYGLRAAEQLLRSPYQGVFEDVWLFYSQDLFVNASYALARTGDLPAAITVLERGRTRLLVKTLSRNRALHASGHAELSESYRNLEAATRLLDMAESWSGGPRADDLLRLDLAQRMRDVLRQVGVDKEDSSVTDFARIQKILTTPPAGIREPAAGIYIAVADVAGLGMALIVHSDGVKPVWFQLELDPPAELVGLKSLTVETARQYPVTNYLLAQFNQFNETYRLRDALEEILPLLGEGVMHEVALALRDVLPSKKADQGPRLVTIIPCGILSSIPLHATTYHAGTLERTFLEDYSVSYVPSAWILGESQSAISSLPKRPPSLLAVGSPQPTAGRPLIYARLEVETISRMFEEDRAEVLSETDATLQAVEPLLDGAGYLHFSCHGEFNVLQPRSSGILLSNNQRLSLADLLDGRRLTATRLVVLSACQTAVTDFLKLREEAVGLPAGFLQSGAAGVLGTLWPAADLSTALLIIRFYQHHLRQESGTSEDPMPPAEALRIAQIWLRDLTNRELGDVLDTLYRAARSSHTRMSYELARAEFGRQILAEPDERPFRHPYYWAGFEFFGT